MTRGMLVSGPHGTLVLSQSDSYWFGPRRAPSNVWCPPGVAAAVVGSPTPACLADAPDEATATAWAIDCARAFARGDAEWAPPGTKTHTTDAEIVKRCLAEYESAERERVWPDADKAEDRIELLARVLGDRVTP